MCSTRRPVSDLSQHAARKQQSSVFVISLLFKTFGGFMHSGHSAPDEAYCLDGKPLWKLPQREVSTGLNRVSVLLLNSIIIVGASGFLGYERRSDDVVPCCALFCDLQMKHPVWRKFPGWNMSQSRFSAVVFGGEMMLLGGSVCICVLCLHLCLKPILKGRFLIVMLRFLHRRDL